MAETTLAEVFLGLGGRTAQVLGTAFTAGASLYAINKSSGHGISFLETLPYWLGMKNDETNEKTVTRQQVINEVMSYGKIAIVIALGVGIKKFGNFCVMDTTIGWFNGFLYAK
jgi:hypothetical protein